MAAKRKAVLLFAIAIAASSRVFASIPRNSSIAPASIDRYELQDETQQANDRQSIDNERLIARALRGSLPAPVPLTSLSETRVWGLDYTTPLERRVEPPLK